MRVASLEGHLGAARGWDRAAGARRGGGQAWIVGGAVRERRSAARSGPRPRGRRRPEAAAKAIAREGGGHSFELSAEFATWRAVAGDRRLAGRRCRAARRDDRGGLAERDFTIGAVAVPLAGGEPVDPHGGLADLERRCCGSSASAASPTTPCACCGRRAWPRSWAGGRSRDRCARSRRSGACRRGGGRAPAGRAAPADRRARSAARARAAGRAGLTPVVLPEMEALRGVEQGPNHHLDVHGHTMAVLGHTLEVEADLERFGGERAAEVEGATRRAARQRDDGAARRCASAPCCTTSASRRPGSERDGYVTFIGHDSDGAEIVGELCAPTASEPRG